MKDSANMFSMSASRLATTRALINTARTWAATNGLKSFTLDELCAEVGISRRTFFNYFASKDDAVIGIPLERFDEQASEDFASKGAASNTLISDLAELTLARWAFFDLAPQTISELRQTVEQEPRLLARMVAYGQQNEALDIALIKERESTAEPARAKVAAHFVGSLARAAARDFLDSENTESYSTVFARWVNETGALIAS